eukprot:351841-Chlamydomonas_euryale.AAC.8
MWASYSTSEAVVSVVEALEPTRQMLFEMQTDAGGTGDVGRETWDGRCGMGDVGREMWDGRCGTGDVGQEMWDGRCGTGDADRCGWDGRCIRLVASTAEALEPIQLRGWAGQAVRIWPADPPSPSESGLPIRPPSQSLACRSALPVEVWPADLPSQSESGLPICPPSQSLACRSALPVRVCPAKLPSQSESALPSRPPVPPSLSPLLGHLCPTPMSLLPRHRALLIGTTYACVGGQVGLVEGCPARPFPPVLLQCAPLSSAPLRTANLFHPPPPNATQLNPTEHHSPLHLPTSSSTPPPHRPCPLE